MTVIGPSGLKIWVSELPSEYQFFVFTIFVGFGISASQRFFIFFISLMYLFFLLCQHRLPASLKGGRL